MLRSQILVILSADCDGYAAACTVRQAQAKAAQEQLLRFAVPKECGDSFWAFLADEIPRDSVALYEGSLDGLATERGHFLLLDGQYDFAPEWDRLLYTAWQRLGQDRTLLTGSMEPPVNAAYGQVRLPALTDDAAISKGMPLICAAGPVRTLVADPAFVFGPLDFLQEKADCLSLAAFAGGYIVYVAAEAYAWPVGRRPQHRLNLPSSPLPGTTPARFAQLTGLGHEVGRVKASMGLFGVANTYPQRLPQGMQLHQRIRRLGFSEREKRLPLLVSVFIDLPERTLPAASYILRFGFLRDMQSLSLLLYTGGSQERALRAALPNTQSYPDQMVKNALPMAIKPRERFQRSKPLLVRRAAQRQAEFTHAAWMDMDTLCHPICADAEPDFRPVMDGRIHMAVVDGTLDASFFVAPVALLGLLEKQTLELTQLDSEMKRPLTENALWERLYAQMPQLFAIHPMPARRLLFISLLDRRLLSADERARLADIPQPYYPNGEGEKRQNK